MRRTTPCYSTITGLTLLQVIAGGSRKSDCEMYVTRGEGLLAREKRSGLAWQEVSRPDTRGPRAMMLAIASLVRSFISSPVWTGFPSGFVTGVMASTT